MSFLIHYTVLTATIIGLVGLLANTKLRPNSKLTELLNEFVEMEVGRRLVEANSTLQDRLLLGIAIIIMLFVQMMVAGETLPESDVEALRSFVELGIVDLAVFEIAAYLVILWMMAPILSWYWYCLRNRHSIIAEARARPQRKEESQ